MKQIILIFFSFLCVSLNAAEYLKVGQTKTFSVGNISHLQGCAWTISRPSNVTFVQTPGKYDTSATIKATQEFSGDPCIVQCTYYYLELDPVSGRYIYSRSGYKSWHVFVEKNGEEDNPGDIPDTPETTNIELYSTEVSVYAGDKIDIKVRGSFGKIINWHLADETIAKGTSLNDGWTLRVEGMSTGTTWAYASDAGGGKASCKITVSQRHFIDGDYFKYPADTYETLSFTVTDINKKECKLNCVGWDYNINQTDGLFVVPEKVYGLTVVRIGSNAFSSKTKNIKKIILPNTIREIDDWAFSECELEEIELPIGLSSIGEGAFCKSKLKSILIPEGVKSLGVRCFYNCSSLTSVVLPSTLHEISQECFGRCSQLKDVTLTDGIEKLAFGTFLYSSVNNIVLPKSIKTIENNSLNCPLVSIACLGEVPCVLEGGAVGYNVTTLYVPKNSIEAYQVADEWKKFKSIREIGDIEEAMYICGSNPMIESLDKIYAKITHKEGQEAYYTDLINYKYIPNAFTIAEYDGNELHKYGTNSTQPIFTSSEIESGKAEKTFTLHPYEEENVGNFILPEDWGNRNLLFSIYKYKKEVTLVYDKNMTDIKTIVANDKEITVSNLNGVIVYRGENMEKVQLPLGTYIVRDRMGNKYKVIIKK